MTNFRETMNNILHNYASNIAQEILTLKIIFCSFEIQILLGVLYFYLRNLAPLYQNRNGCGW